MNSQYSCTHPNLYQIPKKSIDTEEFNRVRYHLINLLESIYEDGCIEGMEYELEQVLKPFDIKLPSKPPTMLMECQLEGFRVTNKSYNLSIYNEDLEHAKLHLISLVKDIYETGSIDGMEHHLEEILRVFGLRLPGKNPQVKKKSTAEDQLELVRSYINQFNQIPGE